MKKFFAFALLSIMSVASVEAGDFFLKNAERKVDFNECVMATNLVGLEYDAEVKIVHSFPGYQIARFDVTKGSVVIICDGESRTMTIAAYN